MRRRQAELEAQAEIQADPEQGDPEQEAEIQADPEQEDPVQAELEALGYKELQAIASGLGIKTVGVKKDELIEAIKASE